MRGTHGWDEINEARKSEILASIEKGEATSGPSHVELDLTDRCNVACYFCNQQDVRTTQQISLEHLRALIDELAEMGVKSVRLAGGGDPLAHRDMGKVLDHLALRNIVVDNLTTNAALMTRDICEKLVANKAREVVVSLNASNPAEYARMMQVKPSIFDKVLENVRTLVELRGDAPGPGIVVQFLLDRKSYPHLVEMYQVGRSIGADRIAVALVLVIPNARIDPEILLGIDDGKALEPYVREILALDRDRRLLQIDFPLPQWNYAIAQIKQELGYPPEPSLFPTAPSFQAKNGACFFGFYTATIRGNGDLYPCCLLMSPDYKPLGNALEGSFSSHWKGPQFTQLRTEMRDVLLDGEKAKFDPERNKVLRPQCITEGACWLKNMYFRGDEDFYRRLGEALERARRKNRVPLALRRGLRLAKKAARRVARVTGVTVTAPPQA